VNEFSEKKIMTFALLRRSMLGVFVAALVAVPSARADQKAIQEARKAESEAKVNVAKAQKAVDQAKEAAKAKDPAYAAAQKESSKAKLEHDNAARAATESARASAEYTAAKKQFDDADAKMTGLHRRGSKTPRPSIRARGYLRPHGGETGLRDPFTRPSRASGGRVSRGPVHRWAW
jgi:hypothetical protein